MLTLPVNVFSCVTPVSKPVFVIVMSVVFPDKDIPLPAVIFFPLIIADVGVDKTPNEPVPLPMFCDVVIVPELVDVTCTVPEEPFIESPAWVNQ